MRIFTAIAIATCIACCAQDDDAVASPSVDALCSAPTQGMPVSPTTYAYEPTVSFGGDERLLPYAHDAVGLWSKAGAKMSVSGTVRDRRHHIEMVLCDVYPREDQSEMTLATVVFGKTRTYIRVTPFGASMPTRLPQIIAHELGHIYGLYHSTDRRSLMFRRNSDQAVTSEDVIRLILSRSAIANGVLL